MSHPIKPGTRVRIINYGSQVWRPNEDGSVEVLDILPELVGREGTISHYTRSTIPNSPYVYAIDLDKGGKHAWYNMSQVEVLPIINPNPNPEPKPEINNHEPE